jgi:hypothetical protein
MKDIRDYLHLYMKCWGTFTRVTDNDCYKRYENGEWALSGSLYQEIMAMGHEFKPHLRPLSDMTGDEHRKWDELYDAVDEAAPPPIENAEQVRWMLSKGFDLFGLIESGLAIDKNGVNDQKS